MAAIDPRRLIPAACALQITDAPAERSYRPKPAASSRLPAWLPAAAPKLPAAGRATSYWRASSRKRRRQRPKPGSVRGRASSAARTTRGAELVDRGVDEALGLVAILARQHREQDFAGRPRDGKIAGIVVGVGRKKKPAQPASADWAGLSSLKRWLCLRR